MKAVLLIALSSISVIEALINRGGPPAEKKCEDTLCPTDFVGYGGHCYFFSSSTMSYANSKSDCQSRGAYLVRIDSEQENNWLYNQVKTQKDSNTDIYFTGGNNLNGGKWLWIDNGGEFIYSSWKTTPTGAETLTKALVLSADGNVNPVEWEIDEVSNTLYYICEAQSKALFEFVKRNTSKR